MKPIRIIALPTALAESVRETGRAPGYGHPAHTETANEPAPCRHCLRRFRTGEEELTLFTYDPFQDLESLPLPGPVFVHSTACERYPEDAGYPPELRSSPVTLNGYAKGRRLVAQEYATDQDLDMIVDKLLERAGVDYIHVRYTRAGCYAFRMERVSDAE